MCLIVLGWQAHRDYPLIGRRQPRRVPCARARRPPPSGSDQPAILAGRDLEAMGTWMGVAARGRFAAVTNYRGAREPRPRESRGALVTDFLAERRQRRRLHRAMSLSAALATAASTCWSSDGEELWWMSNRDGAPRRLEPGHLRAWQPAARLARGRAASSSASGALDTAPAVEAAVHRARRRRRSSIRSTARAARPCCSMRQGRALRRAHASRPTARTARPLHYQFSTQR